MEVEIKAKISDFGALKKKLQKLGAKFENPKKQLDIYFEKKDQDPGVFNIGRFIVRVRYCDRGYFLTYKELTKTRGIWKEYETGIENPEEMIKILESLDLKEFYHIEKERISGKISKFRFNLDKIKGLGNFMEVELISDDGERAQEEIKNLYSKIGIRDDELERRGYGELWQEKHGGGIKIDEQQ